MLKLGYDFVEFVAVLFNEKTRFLSGTIALSIEIERNNSRAGVTEELFDSQVQVLKDDLQETLC
jgi:hypothetical protein